MQNIFEYLKNAAVEIGSLWAFLVIVIFALVVIIGSNRNEEKLKKQKKLQ